MQKHLWCGGNVATNLFQYKSNTNKNNDNDSDMEKTEHHSSGKLFA